MLSIHVNQIERFGGGRIGGASEQEIVRGQFGRAVEMQVEIGSAVPVDIALQRARAGCVADLRAVAGREGGLPMK